MNKWWWEQTKKVNAEIHSSRAVESSNMTANAKQCEAKQRVKTQAEGEKREKRIEKVRVRVRVRVRKWREKIWDENEKRK